MAKSSQHVNKINGTVSYSGPICLGTGHLTDNSPRQQLIKTVDRMISDVRENVTQICLRIVIRGLESLICPPEIVKEILLAVYECERYHVLLTIKYLARSIADI